VVGSLAVVTKKGFGQYDVALALRGELQIQHHHYGYMEAALSKATSPQERHILQYRSNFLHLTSWVPGGVAGDIHAKYK